MAGLFSPLAIRGRTFKNRAWVSPMCQYSATDGDANDWHLVHLGSLATGGAGLVLTESTAVTPEGRISPLCTGIWRASQVEKWSRVVRFAHAQTAAIGVQLAHSGRKGSTSSPWSGEVDVPVDEGGWTTVAPSAVPYGDLRPPEEMSVEEVAGVVAAFVAAAERARLADFDVIELHAAHGYLLHEFLSPVTNQRTDSYGGSDENRMRLPLEVASAVRDVWDDDRPLFVRISTTAWLGDPADEIQHSVELARRFAECGVDVIDCSSGGLVPDAVIPSDAGYQTALAATVRARAGVATVAVGRIESPRQADRLVTGGSADAVFIGRAMLRNPHWPLAANDVLSGSLRWPVQYERAQATPP